MKNIGYLLFAIITIPCVINTACSKKDETVKEYTPTDFINRPAKDRVLSSPLQNGENALTAYRLSGFEYLKLTPDGFFKMSTDQFYQAVDHTGDDGSFLQKFQARDYVVWGEKHLILKVFSQIVSDYKSDSDFFQKMDKCYFGNATEKEDLLVNAGLSLKKTLDKTTQNRQNANKELLFLIGSIKKNKSDTSALLSFTIYGLELRDGWYNLTLPPESVLASFKSQEYYKRRGNQLDLLELSFSAAQELFVMWFGKKPKFPSSSLIKSLPNLCELNTAKGRILGIPKDVGSPGMTAFQYFDESRFIFMGLNMGPAAIIWVEEYPYFWRKTIDAGVVIPSEM